MSLLSLDSVGVSFGATDVFEGVSCEANLGDRIGLVGRNGAGKTSLLRVMAGVERPTSGRRHLARGLICHLVEQVPATADGARTVRQEARSALEPLIALERELEAAATALAGDEKGADGRYADLLEHFDHAGGFGYEARMNQVLAGLGFEEPAWDTRLGELSGGQRGRLALAKALLAEPDILIMDEPTNHLDLKALRWLEGFLGRWRGTLIVTSHDRYFLDAVATRIWHLDFGRLKAYPGNYSKFEELRSAETERQQKQFEAQQEVIAREEAFIRRYGAGQRAREARGREKKLARLQRLEAPTSKRSASLSFGAARSGDIVLDAEGLSVGYDGETVVRCGDLDLARGDRVALIGPNGAGKSTLLKTIAGELRPTAGRLRLGARVRVAHYWQEAENLRPEATVLGELLRASTLGLQEARDHLGRFLFSGDEVEKRVTMLSGGERSRLALAMLVLSEANLLLLDEPTNHLDIPSREALEAALSRYTGTLVFASHDRRLIARLAARLWVVEGDDLRSLDGTLEEYDRQQEQTGAAPAERPRVAMAATAAKPAGGRRRLEAISALEEQIQAHEQELDALGAAINQASGRQDSFAVAELGQRFEAQQATVAKLMRDWERLSADLD